MNPKVILVTGCAGFIGSNFVKKFKDEFPKTQIVGIDDFSTGRRENIEALQEASAGGEARHGRQGIKNFVFYEGSILDEKLLEKIFKNHRPEFVFHFAALPRVSYSVEHPRRTSEVNILGTVSLLEHSKNYGVKRFIYSSSSAVYGGAKKLPTKESENPIDLKSPYAVQKYAGEPFCKIFSNLFGLDTVCLRYFNVFGPGQYGDSPYSTVVSAWLESLYFPEKKPGSETSVASQEVKVQRVPLRGTKSEATELLLPGSQSVPQSGTSRSSTTRKAFIEGDGKQSRDFCYVDNVVSANILAMKAKKNFHGEAFNIAHGERTALNEIKKLIEEYTGKKLSLEQRPPRLGDVRHTHADIAKAKKWFGYVPLLDFETGLQETVKWFEQRV